MADFSLVYADDTLLVLNKPSGLLSVPGRGEDKQDCLSRRVQHCYPDAMVVHRLDMATSGLIVMARGSAAQLSLNNSFAQRRVHKRYEALVLGTLKQPGAAWQLIDLPIAVDWPNRPKRIIDPNHGKPSQTRWKIIATDPMNNTTRVALEPITGRSHQLRVHMLAIGHAIVGDQLYGTPEVVDQSHRLLLHACELELTHPTSQQTMRFVSPVPF